MKLQDLGPKTVLLLSLFIKSESENEDSNDDAPSVIDPNLILEDMKNKLDMPTDQLKEIVDKVISGLSEGVILE